MDQLAEILLVLRRELPSILIAVAFVIGGFYLGSMAEKVIRKMLLQSKADPGVSGMIAETARWLTIGLGMLLALGMFIDVTAFLTTLGIAGIAIGFALQDVLKNFTAGVLILLQHPYRVGETVWVSNYEGVVTGITSRATEIQTNDGRMVTLPNANILNQPIINYTRSPKRRLEIPMRAGYDSDVAVIRESILDSIRGMPGVYSEPTPMVNVDTFGESSYGLMIYVWIDTGVFVSTLVARDQVINKITRALEAKGIKLPTPMQHILVENL